MYSHLRYDEGKNEWVPAEGFAGKLSHVFSFVVRDRKGVLFASPLPVCVEFFHPLILFFRGADVDVLPGNQPTSVVEGLPSSFFTAQPDLSEGKK